MHQCGELLELNRLPLACRGIRFTCSINRGIDVPREEALNCRLVVGAIDRHDLPYPHPVPQALGAYARHASITPNCRWVRRSIRLVLSLHGATSLSRLSGGRARPLDFRHEMDQTADSTPPLVTCAGSLKSPTQPGWRFSFSAPLATQYMFLLVGRLGYWRAVDVHWPPRQVSQSNPPHHVDASAVAVQSIGAAATRCVQRLTRTCGAILAASL